MRVGGKKHDMCNDDIVCMKHENAGGAFLPHNVNGLLNVAFGDAYVLGQCYHSWLRHISMKCTIQLRIFNMAYNGKKQ